MRSPLFGLAAGLCLALFAGVASAQAPVARVSNGALEGVRQDGVAAYLGIPYAAPPVGANRWRPPQPVPSWGTVRKAATFGADCPQKIAPNGFGPWSREYITQGPVSEDCLFLNVWVPEPRGAGPLPVLFWMHGGGLAQGSSAVPIYDGAGLARKGVIVVSINYRLGVLGFLSHPALSAESGVGASGNYAVLDAIAALRWTRDNIRAFGGDPDRVTIAGQSAGSSMVHALIAAPDAKSLFSRAIAQSGSGTRPPALTLAAAEADGVKLADGLKVKTLAQLRALPPSAFIPEEMTPVGPFGIRFGIVADGRALMADPAAAVASGQFNDTPILTGMVADEGSSGETYGQSTSASLPSDLERMFAGHGAAFAALYPAGSDAEASAQIKAAARDNGMASLLLWAEARRKTSREPIFAYLFDHPEPGPDSARYASFHSSEIPYAMRTLDKADRPFAPIDSVISDRVSSYWVNFARTGDPNGPGLEPWPRLQADERIMVLGDRFEARPALPQDKRQRLAAFITRR